MVETVRALDVEAVTAALYTLDADTARERLAWIRDLSVLQNAVTGCLAALAAEHRREQVAADEARGIPERDRGRHVASEVALARRISHGAALAETARATRVMTSLPQVAEAWRSGMISQQHAGAAATLAGSLADDQLRARFDRRAADLLPGVVPSTALRRLTAVVNEIDPDGALERMRGNESERRVSFRSAPLAGLGCLSALLPLRAQVACRKSLHEAWKAAQADPDITLGSREQFYADELTRRLTGAATLDEVGIVVHVVMSKDALTGATEQSATLDGEPIPAQMAREMIASSDGRVELERWLTDPDAAFITATETTTRRFAGRLRTFVLARDGGTCRGPNCAARAAEIDHAIPWRAGGVTSAANGQALCKRCNLAKERMTVTELRPATEGGPPGWRWRTPNGLTFDSYPPPPLHHEPPPPPRVDFVWPMAAAP